MAWNLGAGGHTGVQAWGCAVTGIIVGRGGQWWVVVVVALVLVVVLGTDHGAHLSADAVASLLSRAMYSQMLSPLAISNAPAFGAMCPLEVANGPTRFTDGALLLIAKVSAPHARQLAGSSE